LLFLGTAVSLVVPGALALARLGEPVLFGFLIGPLMKGIVTGTAYGRAGRVALGLGSLPCNALSAAVLLAALLAHFGAFSAWPLARGAGMSTIVLVLGLPPCAAFWYRGLAPAPQCSWAHAAVVGGVAVLVNVPAILLGLLLLLLAKSYGV
jgi:hypothetical protein